MYEDALYLNTTEHSAQQWTLFTCVQSSLNRAIVHGSWLCAKNLENIKDYQLNSLTKERSEAPAKCIFACALYSEIMWFGLIWAPNQDHIKFLFYPTNVQTLFVYFKRTTSQDHILLPPRFAKQALALLICLLWLLFSWSKKCSAALSGC